MREELVLKTAVLAERFYPDLPWYVDSMLALIERAGEFASKDLWHSTVQLVTNYPSLHEYAARQVLPAHCCSSLSDACFSDPPMNRLHHVWFCIRLGEALPLHAVLAEVFVAHSAYTAQIPSRVSLCSLGACASGGHGQG